ncbi:MAG: putative porin [Rikenellaceae bacterium]
MNFKFILKNIALTLLFLSALLLGVSPLWAQTTQEILDSRAEESTYGTNPFASPDGAEGTMTPPPADSVEEVKIRKPLESYFFSDSVRAMVNFRWNIERGYNRVDIIPMDTTLLDWRIDYPYQKEGVGDITLGGLGQATEPLNFFDRKTYQDFDFARGFDAYIFDMQSVNFYNTKHPFTQFTYLESGQKNYREVNFAINHAQNINPTTGFNIEYLSRGTKGLYDRQETKNHNLALTFAHTGKRYSVFAGYVNNYIKTEESGGVVGEWTIQDTIFEMEIGIPMKLADAAATNTYRNNSFFVQQSYGIPLQRMTPYDFSLSSLSAVYIGHSFEYNSWSKSYKDVYATYTDDRAYRGDDGAYVSAEGEYYDNWYINPLESRDSLYERVITNRLFIQAQPWDRDGVVGTIDGGIGVDFHTYSQFVLDDYISGEMGVDKYTSWFGYGSVKGSVSRYADWGADIKYNPSGYRAGDLTMGAELTLKAYVKDRPLILSGSYKFEHLSPTYWQQSLFTNHFAWFNDYEKEEESRFNVSFKVPDLALELGFNQSILNNKIYYDENAIVQQSDETISITGIYARKDFRVGGMHFDHKVLVQFTSNDLVVPLPLASAYLSYYYEFWAVKDVLRLQIGLDCRYTTSYYMPGYNPALSQFYNQRELEAGDYPYTDAYLMAKWKRMRIFFKYQHLNNNLYGNDNYFSTAYYPQNPGMFKMGISWGFYD